MSCEYLLNYAEGICLRHCDEREREWLEACQLIIDWSFRVEIKYACSCMREGGKYLAVVEWVVN